MTRDCTRAAPKKSWEYWAWGNAVDEKLGLHRLESQCYRIFGFRAAGLDPRLVGVGQLPADCASLPSKASFGLR